MKLIMNRKKSNIFFNKSVDISFQMCYNELSQKGIGVIIMKLPTKVKNDLKKFNSLESTFTSNKDYGIHTYIKNLCRASSVLSNFAVEPCVERIEGWFKTNDGTYRKDYTIGFNNYEDLALLSIYADDNFDTTEVNVYFIN